MTEEDGLKAKLVQLREEHRDLDTAIDALVVSSSYDQLQVLRLKKKKLSLKDEMARIADTLLPDIIA